MGKRDYDVIIGSGPGGGKGTAMQLAKAGQSDHRLGHG